MEQENAVLVQWSFRELLSRDSAVDALLERLYAHAPELAGSIPASGAVQRRRLTAAVAFALKSLDDYDTLRPALLALDLKLRQGGVTDHDALKAAALAALRDVHGPAWTVHLGNAWDDVLDTFGATMRESGENSRAAA